MKSSSKTNPILSFSESSEKLDNSRLPGEFFFQPLEPGYGIAVGNSLQRILLSSLDGYAIYALRIDHIKHLNDFTQYDDELINNIKNVRLKRITEESQQADEEIHIHLKNVSKLTARDIGRFSKNFEVLNPDLIVSQFKEGTEVLISVLIGFGSGYTPSEAIVIPEDKPSYIPIDTTYTPVQYTSFSVETYSIVKSDIRLNYERLHFKIETDGSIKPKAALKKAANILIHHFMLFSDENMSISSEETTSSEIEENYDSELIDKIQVEADNVLTKINSMITQEESFNSWLRKKNNNT